MKIIKSKVLDVYQDTYLKRKIAKEVAWSNYLAADQYADDSGDPVAHDKAMGLLQKYYDAQDELIATMKVIVEDVLS